MNETYITVLELEDIYTGANASVHLYNMDNQVLEEIPIL